MTIFLHHVVRRVPNSQYPTTSPITTCRFSGHEGNASSWTASHGTSMPARSPKGKDQGPLQGLSGLTFKQFHPAATDRHVPAFLQALPDLYRKPGVEILCDGIFKLPMGQAVQWEEISARPPSFLETLIQTSLTESQLTGTAKTS